MRWAWRKNGGWNRQSRFSRCRGVLGLLEDDLERTKLHMIQERWFSHEGGMNVPRSNAYAMLFAYYSWKTSLFLRVTSFEQIIVVSNKIPIDAKKCSCVRDWALTIETFRGCTVSPIYFIQEQVMSTPRFWHQPQPHRVMSLISIDQRR